MSLKLKSCFSELISYTASVIVNNYHFDFQLCDRSGCCYLDINMIISTSKFFGIDSLSFVKLLSLPRSPARANNKLALFTFEKYQFMNHESEFLQFYKASCIYIMYCCQASKPTFRSCTALRGACALRDATHRRHVRISSRARTCASYWFDKLITD